MVIAKYWRLSIAKMSFIYEPRKYCLLGITYIFVFAISFIVTFYSPLLKR